MNWSDGSMGCIILLVISRPHLPSNLSKFVQAAGEQTRQMSDRSDWTNQRVVEPILEHASNDRQTRLTKGFDERTARVLLLHDVMSRRQSCSNHVVHKCKCPEAQQTAPKSPFSAIRQRPHSYITSAIDCRSMIDFCLSFLDTRQ